MIPKKVRDEWRRAFVQDAAVTARLCDDLDVMEAELAKQEARIAELERERDDLCESITWRCIDCGAIQPFDYETRACGKCKATYKLMPYHQWKRETAEAERDEARSNLATLTARNAERRRLLGEWIEIIRRSRGSQTAKEAARDWDRIPKLIEETERALAQTQETRE